MTEVVLNLGEVELINHTGSDLMCVNAARASFGKQVTEMGEKDIKLLQRLINDGHHSTLEHTLFTFRIKAPIFVARQWMRHRIASYNERSGRYCEPEYECFVPEQDFKRGIYEGSVCAIKNFNNWAISQYHDLLKEGVPKEVARTILPQGLYTNFYFTCNLRSFIHFYELRSSPHAQYEIRVYAEAMMRAVQEIDGKPFKHTLAALEALK